jgi:hypothetical protein
LQLAEFDALRLPITDNCGFPDRHSYERRLNQSIDIITRILDVNGKAGIVRFLGRLASMEPRIQDLQPWVRDHVVHAIYTFLVGAYIIEKINMPQNVERRFDYPFMWKLCGPVHDLGYPIEISRNIGNEFWNELNAILDETNSASPRVLPPVFHEELAELCNGRDANQLL